MDIQYPVTCSLFVVLRSAWIIYDVVLLLSTIILWRCLLIRLLLYSGAKVQKWRVRQCEDLWWLSSTFDLHLFFLNKNLIPYHFFGYAKLLCNNKEQCQIHPFPVHWVSGDSPVSCGNHKTCPKYVQQCCLKPQHVPPKTLNKGQLQTCCKLWPHAFGSCQMTEVVWNTFKAERVLNYCYLSRQQHCEMIAHKGKDHCQSV